MFAPFFKRKRTWLVIAGFVIFAIMLLIMPIEAKQQATEKLDIHSVRIGLGIFACIAFLWLTEALPLSATALLVPILAIVTGVFDVKAALSAFAHPLIFIFFGGFALASAMAYQGVDRWIANRVVIAGRGSLIVSSALLFSATAFLSMWMSNTATTAMMIPLVLGILSQAKSGDDEADHKTAIFLLLGVAYAASVGGIGTIIGSPPNGIAAKAMGISFIDWMKFGIPSVLLLLPLMFIVLLIVSKPSTKQPITINKEKFVFNWHRIAVLLIFACTALAWIFSKKIGAVIGVSKYMDTLIALSAVIAVLYFRVVRWRDIDHGTDWGVLLLFGGGLTLSAIMKKTGASLFLARGFSDLVADLPIILIVAAVIAFIIFLTELSSNTATAALFVPIFMAVSEQMGIVPAQLVIPLALAASCAFMLPIATPPNAIVFGTGRIPQKSMMRIGLVLNIVFIIALTLLSQLIF
ncbi:MAG: Anion transporter [Gammaproteobacteria bacterium]|nr:MAG: Anion transporter [Gammaproteobacteria bacterium]